jgi:hypothetical protein
MEIVIAIGVIVWIIGFVRVGRTIEDGLLVNRTFVRPPFFIYLLCGMPRARHIPAGVMAIPSLFLQLHGLFSIICGLITILVTPNIVLAGGVYILGIVLIVIYILVLYKNNSYNIDQHPENVSSEENL